MLGGGWDLLCFPCFIISLSLFFFVAQMSSPNGHNTPLFAFPKNEMAIVGWGPFSSALQDHFLSA